eukprot:7224215-Pyramimonas_sp.AAC.1
MGPLVHGEALVLHAACPRGWIMLRQKGSTRGRSTSASQPLKSPKNCPKAPSKICNAARAAAERAAKGGGGGGGGGGE